MNWRISTKGTNVKILFLPTDRHLNTRDILRLMTANYNYMKLSLPGADGYEDNFTHWDHYKNAKIP